MTTFGRTFSAILKQDLVNATSISICVIYLNFGPFSGFIRGLLENVGSQIDPQRLIRRIRNGLEIPGLKEALIKILWDFNLQVYLLYALVISIRSFVLPSDIFA
jgi:hypothetical protein